MDIYLSCPITNLVSYKNNYLEIRKAVLKLGHHLKSDLLLTYVKLAEANKPIVPSQEAYKKTISSIIKSDAVICDITVKSTSMGHIITFAINKHKPVLVLYQKESNNPSHIFLAMSQSPLLVVKSYKSKDEILPILEKFLFSAGKKSKTRFNLVINNAQNAYLDWVAFTNKKSKTKIIQEAIDEKIDRDKSYKKY